MEQPLKILVVTAMFPTIDRPGHGTFVWQQVQSLRSLGHTVEVENFPGYRNRLFYVTTLAKVFWRTMREGFDVVHAHYGLTGASALFRWKTPLVVTFHGGDALCGGIQGFISKIVSRLTAENIVVSKAIQELIPGVLIPCGIDLHRFRPMDRLSSRAELGLDQKGKIVLFPFDPAREEKRFDRLKKAVEILESWGKHVWILSIHNVTQERMSLYYAAADLTVICSDTEGSSTCLKESLACGTPVLSTDVGDAREVLEGLESGTIVAGQPESIARGMMELLGRPDQKIGVPTTVRCFDDQVIAEKVVRVYRNALAGYRGRSRRAKAGESGQEPGAR